MINTLAIAAAWSAASAAYARLQALRNDAQAAYDRQTLAQNVADEWGDWRRSASSPGFEVEFRSACVVLEAAEDEFCDASDRADAGWREWGAARALLRGLLLAKYGIQDD